MTREEAEKAFYDGAAVIFAIMMSAVTAAELIRRK